MTERVGVGRADNSSAKAVRLQDRRTSGKGTESYADCAAATDSLDAIPVFEAIAWRASANEMG